MFRSLRGTIFGVAILMLTSASAASSEQDQVAHTEATRSFETAANSLPSVSPALTVPAVLSDNAADALFKRLGILRSDFPDDRSRTVANSVGFAVYDRAHDTVVLSYNADLLLNLASTTKLFTMAVVGKEFAGDPILVQHQQDMEKMLLESDNRVASMWMLLANDRFLGRPTDYVGWNSRMRARCYGDPKRDAHQQTEEAVAIRRFFALHRAIYRISWDHADIVDGAGCESGLWRGGADRMSPRQYLTVLDALRQRDFGGWNAFRLMPQKRFDGTPPPTKIDGRQSGDARIFAWKTGGDKRGIRNIAGYIPRDRDPFAYYFVLLINTGRSPPKQIGLINGGQVLNGFVAWVAQTLKYPAMSNGAVTARN